MDALLARTVGGIELGGIACELVRTAQRFLLDPGQHVRRGQRAAHVVEHDAIDLGMVSDHAPAYRGSAVLVRSAPVRASVHLHHRAAAMAAAQDAAEERRRHATAAFAAPSTPRRSHALAYCLPWLVIQNTQLEARDRLPFAFRPNESFAFPRIGILDPFRAVPYVTADVELVVQHARALGRRAVERRHAPGSTPRAAHTARVKVRGDALAGLACPIAREDLAHDRRLCLVDLQPVPYRLATRIDASDHGAVTVGETAGVIATLNLACEAAMRLGAQVIEIRFTDETAHTTEQLSPGT